MAILDAIKDRKNKGFKIEISIEPSDEKSMAKKVELEVEKESGDEPSDDGLTGPNEKMAESEIMADMPKKKKSFFEKAQKNIKDFESKGKGK